MPGDPERKMEMAGTTLRKADTAIEKKAPVWNHQMARNRPCSTWRRTVEEEAASVGRTWGQLRGLARDQNEWVTLPFAYASDRGRQESGQVSHVDFKTQARSLKIQTKLVLIQSSVSTKFNLHTHIIPLSKFCF